jgi:hypothetical protein
MGYKQVRTSDLSGQDLKDDEIVTVVVKGHPIVTDNKVFDTTEDELAPLKTVSGLVELEIRNAAGSTRSVYVTAAELAKVIPDEKLQGFDSTRGRRSGYRPGNGNGN